MCVTYVHVYVLYVPADVSIYCTYILRVPSVFLHAPYELSSTGHCSPESLQPYNGSTSGTAIG